jgi:hypothetical protein
MHAQVLLENKKTVFDGTKKGFKTEMSELKEEHRQNSRSKMQKKKITWASSHLLPEGTK